MFYKQTQPHHDLTGAQMDAARKAFRGKLLRLRYSPQFIVNNADELLAIAHSEYARAVANGVEIEDPVAWTVHCAWRRTQNLLQAERIHPRTVSEESVAELIDEATTTPEDQALDDDRARRVREAVGKLDEGQREVIALTFFEEMSVREAARLLGCSASSVQHRRETALETLRRFLPFRSGDDIVVDVAMACWVSLALERSGLHLPAGFEAVIDRTGHGASGLWGRVQDLARRFGVGGGGEAATAVASSGAGRAAGVCAAGFAAVCLAGAGTGIVGPGMGVIGGGSHHPAPTQHEQRPRRDPVKRVRPNNTTTATTATTTTSTPHTTPAESPAPSPAASSSAKKTTKQHTEATQESVAKTVAGAEHEEVTQVEEETSGIARAGAEAPATTPTVASASDQESSGSPTVVHTGSPSPSPASKAAAAGEFGFEK